MGCHGCLLSVSVGIDAATAWPSGGWWHCSGATGKFGRGAAITCRH
ncbi:hypothetical protein X805_13690 [Sphaerotilus natans subsp. natans DSM 6575]|uniref:Uncharacterized protein n=1 Tax=Sphaerotilus natans subsp. natans DSM 6575 TaxID=1286631 RepID=A0A059KNJ3_9BURK|nr:hypothetical protein X805_13690 [Sphaerotilus natans subsp. natans DSM 6575]